MANRYDCIDSLTRACISYADATALRRISMTLHRWHELECGDSNDYASWCITRGERKRVERDGVQLYEFVYDDNGAPFMERHPHDTNAASYTRLPDRERGALKRLAKIMARYPAFISYVQGDPRGCALYILRPGDVREGASIDSCYSNGIAVCK